MKTMAMYLPQFHEIPENNKWWGEGFTEWTAVKNAKPLFDGHNQPRVPLNNNYYNLLDKKTVEWQAELMHEYGIDGLCIYHYWFNDGRKILERPAENLLKWTEIDMPFCFCWANETWARTWSEVGKYSNNSWGDIYEPERSEEINGNPTGILLEQGYGCEKTWINHFTYLLPFFKDKRYICIDNKPIIVIYKATEIGCLGDMINCWRRLADKSGLSGLYIIAGGLDKDISSIVDAIYYRAPTDVQNIWNIKSNQLNGIKYVSYHDVWDEILSAVPKYKTDTYFMGVTGYDASPRKGRNASIYEEGTPEEFEKYLYKLFWKNKVYGSDITFLNAWNEWGEGMYLEPDQKNGTGFLEAVRNARKDFERTENDYEKRFENKEFDNLKRNYCDLFAYNRRVDKNLFLVDRWLSLQEKGIELTSWFSIGHEGTNVIYGYGLLGKRLCRQMKSRNISLSGVIDTRIEHIGNTIDGLRFFDSLDAIPEIDNVIIAVSCEIDEIYEKLCKIDNINNVYTLEQIICEMENHYKGIN